MSIHKNLATWERAISVVAGGVIVAEAVRRRQGIAAASVVGAALIARGTAGYCPVSAATGLTSRPDDDTRTALGGSRGTKITASVTIDRSQQEVFDFWNDLDNLPMFIRGLQHVREIQPGITEWTFIGAGGIRLCWEAETINAIDPELIAWKSLPDADLVSAGSVHFTDVGNGGTHVTVTMQYDPPGGKLGSALSWLLGRAPQSELDEDLRRLKRLLETGELGRESGRRAGQHIPAHIGPA